MKQLKPQIVCLYRSNTILEALIMLGDTMKTPLTCVLAILMITGAYSLKAQSPKPLSIKWAESTPFPAPTAGYAAGVICGRLVIAGGTYWEGTKGRWTKKLFSASTQAFDPRTRKWEKLPDAPIPFGYAAFTTVANRLFVLGGHTGAGVNRKIFTLRKKGDHYVWEQFGEMPFNSLFGGAVSVGKTIYVLSGSTEFEPFDSAGTCCTTKTATNTLFALDTAHPQRGWRQLTPYPGAVRSFFSTETDGKSIWMFGGIFQAEHKDSATKFDEVLRYDLDKKQWAIMPPLPAASLEGGAPSPLFVEGKILLVSGTKRVWQLDPRKLQYSEVSPLPEAASVDKFVWLDHMIVGAGGENSLEGPRRRSEWTFVGWLEAK